MLAPPRGVFFSYSFLFFTHGTFTGYIYWISPPSYYLLPPWSPLRKPFSHSSVNWRVNISLCYRPALLTLNREDYFPSCRPVDKPTGLSETVIVRHPCPCAERLDSSARIPYFTSVDSNYFLGSNVSFSQLNCFEKEMPRARFEPRTSWLPSRCIDRQTLFYCKPLFMFSFFLFCESLCFHLSFLFV